jgi:hypothetical protein
MRSYSAAVGAALGGAFAVTCVSWDARRLLAGESAGKEMFEKRCTGLPCPWITSRPILAFAAFLEDWRQVFPRSRTRNRSESPQSPGITIQSING